MYRVSRFNSSWGIIVSNPSKGWGTTLGWGIIPGDELLFGTNFFELSQMVNVKNDTIYRKGYNISKVENGTIYQS
jgi:hypothetical protein